jgi:hypothetical protein
MNNIIDKFIYVKTNNYGHFPGFMIKKKLPTRFHNVNLKIDKKYIQWIEKEQKKFEDKFYKKSNECWWDSLDDEGIAIMRSIYPTKTKEYACTRRWRFIGTFEFDDNKYPKQKQKYKLIDKSYFNLPCDVYKN